MEAQPSLKKPVFPNQGPREWTPRVADAVLKAEFLRSLIPSELLVEMNEPAYRITDSLTGKQCALILKIHARKWKKSWAPNEETWIEDNVWITEEGTLITEAGIRDLLSGKIKGYEHLSGRWEQWLTFTGGGVPE